MSAPVHELRLHVDLRGAVVPGTGLREITDHADGRHYVVAGAAYLGAPSWFPDPATRKVPVQIDIRCPADFTVIGNGPAEWVDGSWVIRSLRPVPAHLVAFVAGPFHSVGDPAVARFHAKASLACRLDEEAPRLLGDAAAGTSALETLLGCETPWPNNDFVFLPGQGWLAMEYPGCVQLDESLLVPDPPSAAQRAMRAIVVAHELAHMWFGNLVTPAGPEDVWIYEALAELLGVEAAGSAVGADLVARVSSLWRRPPAVRAALREPHRRLADVSVPVDRVGYVKGAAALADLRSVIGHSAFVAGLRECIDRFADSTAAVADVVGCWRELAGSDVDGWAQRWLSSRGVPAVDVRADELRGGSVPRASHTWRVVRLPESDWRTMPRTIARLDDAARDEVWVAARIAAEAGTLDRDVAVDVGAALLMAESDASVFASVARWLVEAVLSHAPELDPVVRRALVRVMARPGTPSATYAVAARWWLDVATEHELVGVLPRLRGPARERAAARLAALGAREGATVSPE